MLNKPQKHTNQTTPKATGVYNAHQQHTRCEVLVRVPLLGPCPKGNPFGKHDKSAIWSHLFVWDSVAHGQGQGSHNQPVLYRVENMRNHCWLASQPLGRGAQNMHSCLQPPTKNSHNQKTEDPHVCCMCVYRRTTTQLARNSEVLPGVYTRSSCREVRIRLFFILQSILVGDFPPNQNSCGKSWHLAGGPSLQEPEFLGRKGFVQPSSSPRLQQLGQVLQAVPQRLQLREDAALRASQEGAPDAPGAGRQLRGGGRFGPTPPRLQGSATLEPGDGLLLVVWWVSGETRTTA